MSENSVFTLQAEFSGQRLDMVIPRLLPELTRSSLKTRLEALAVNGRPAKLSHKAAEGDRVEITLRPLQELDLTPRDIPLEIVYRDEHVAVINKPAGLAVHPSQGHWDESLVHALLHHMEGHLSGIGGVERPGIVHRLDLDTAGLMIIALSDAAHQELVRAFKERRIIKTYEAIVLGHPPAQGEIDEPIGRSARDRKKMTVREDGKPSLTRYRVLEYFDHAAYIEIDLLTGRTHQIRVHFSHLGFPVMGDPLYSRSPQNGLALCARRLNFYHPLTGKSMDFSAELPPHFQKYLEELRKKP